MSQKRAEPELINYAFDEIFIHDIVIIIHIGVTNLMFLCLRDFIFFLQYKAYHKPELFAELTVTRACWRKQNAPFIG